MMDETATFHPDTFRAYQMRLIKEVRYETPIHSFTFRGTRIVLDENCPRDHVYLNGVAFDIMADKVGAIFVEVLQVDEGQ